MVVVDKDNQRINDLCHAIALGHLIVFTLRPLHLPSFPRSYCITSIVCIQIATSNHSGA